MVRSQSQDSILDGSFFDAASVGANASRSGSQGIGSSPQSEVSGKANDLSGAELDMRCKI